MHRREFLKGLGATASLLTLPGISKAIDPKKRPNILWIVAEDASPHIGCYGETTINTPNLDAMAKNGVRFEAAFVTCPVCSPSRSAMITGMYQTTIGAHNHRSQTDSGKAGGNVDYYESYSLPTKLIPQLFKEAGYYVTLGSDPECAEPGKTDYNFIWPNGTYDGPDWRTRPKSKPFFAQVMLSGGKNREAKNHATDPAKVKLPPYYPDHPDLRQDWADYLNSWVQADLETGQILRSLEEAGVADNTIVFFLTDHGVSHLRGKQFLYEEGIRVPLIVLFPDGRQSGEIRKDLVLQIDIAATSLAMAGIEIPRFLEGVDLYSGNYKPRDMIVSAQDRCDESVDIIRCVRTERYKYIRNFLSHLPHAQPNQYKDAKKITQTMRGLHQEGKLNELQARIFSTRRPAEELYDLVRDPHETVNLADKPEHKQVLTELRKELYQWMVRTRDLGLIPEPILEEMGKKYGNKYFVLQQAESENLIHSLITIIEAMDGGNQNLLTKAVESPEPALRYWAAIGLGLLNNPAAADRLSSLLSDPSVSVRISAALSLCRMGLPENEDATPLLVKEIDNSNLIVGLYAIRALELSRVDNPAVREAVKKAQQNLYEFTRRIANRMVINFGA